jgi:hypothetical protein
LNHLRLLPRRQMPDFLNDFRCAHNKNLLRKRT